MTQLETWVVVCIYRCNHWMKSLKLNRPITFWFLHCLNSFSTTHVPLIYKYLLLEGYRWNGKTCTYTSFSTGCLNLAIVLLESYLSTLSIFSKYSSGSKCSWNNKTNNQNPFFFFFLIFPFLQTNCFWIWNQRGFQDKNESTACNNND
jgi:hypothetical protein